MSGAKINSQRLAESDMFIAIAVHAIILGGGIQTCHRNASESEENKTINPLLLSSALLPPNITLLSNGELGTLALGQRDPWLDALPNDEDVGYARGFGMSSRPAQRRKKNLPGGKGAVKGILHVHNIEIADVLLAVNNDTSTTHVTTTGDHDDVTCVELGELRDLVLLQVKTNGVVDLDQRIRVADGPAIVSDDVWNTLGANGNLLDLQKLVGRLLGGDAVDCEAALDIVKEPEVLARLLNGEDICDVMRLRYENLPISDD